MKNQHIIHPIAYEKKHQFHGGFKVIQYYTKGFDKQVRKRTLYKGLSITDAEQKIYELEQKLDNKPKINK
jgi:hypothetical protein